jgi:hypothetical protein
VIRVSVACVAGALAADAFPDLLGIVAGLACALAALALLRVTARGDL